MQETQRHPIRDISLKALLGGVMLITNVSDIPCDMSEKNLLTHYVVVEKTGKGTYHRIYMDKTDQLVPKRCKAEYDFEGLEERINKYLIYFGQPRFYIDQNGK